MGDGRISGSPSHLRPDIGEGTTTDLGRGALPFANLDRRADKEGIVVQIKVLTPDDAEGVRVMGVIENALRNVKVGDKNVVAILTRDSIEMSYVEQERLANLITPFVLRRLGIRDGIGGDQLVMVKS
jgi:hypothetical protein